MFDETELKLLSDFADWAPEQATANSAGVGEILGRNLVNLPSRAGSSLMESLNALANLGLPEAERPKPWALPDLVQPPVLAEDAGMGAKVAEVVTGVVAPEIAALLVPYLGIAKVAKIAGAGTVAATTMANLGQGAIGGAKYGPEEAQRFALTGGALTPISAMPSLLGRAALSAGVAGADFASMRAMGKSNAEAGTGAAVDIIAGMLRLKTPRATTIDPKLAKQEKLKELQREIREVENQINPDFQKQAYIAQLNEEIASLQKSTGLSNEQAQSLNAQEEMAGFVTRSRGYESLLSPMTPTAQPIPMPKKPMAPMAPPMMPIIRAGTPEAAEAARKWTERHGPTLQVDQEGMLRIRRDAQIRDEAEAALGPYLRPAQQVLADPLASLHDLGTPVGNLLTDTPLPREVDVGMQRLAAMVGPQKAKGRMQALPEFMRTQGGFADNEILKTLLSSGASGFAGGAIGGAATGDEAGLFGGMAIGLGAPWALRALKGGSHPIDDIIPAIKVNGKLVRGQKGQTHKQVLDDYISRNPDEAGDALFAFDTPSNPNFFLKGEVPITREQLKEGFGVSDSQGLARLQTGLAESVTRPKGEAGSIPVDRKPATEPDWLKEGRAEMEAKGWNYKWPFIPADLRNKDFVTAIRNDPTIPAAEKEKILSFVPGAPKIASLQKSVPKAASLQDTPNTQKTDLVVKSVVQTETPEFKQWFGDWKNDPKNSSKIVDEKGEPMIMYHGSRSKTLVGNAFEMRDAPGFGTGAYFTKYPDFAKVHAQPRSQGQEGGEVFPVFLNIRNPFISYGNWNQNTLTHIGEFMAKNTPKTFDDLVTNYNAITGNLQRQASNDFDRAATALLRKEGHDGIILHYKKGVDQKDFYEVIAFHPNQIKSATDNSGAFSLKTNDIRGDVARELLLPIAGAAGGATAGYAEAGPSGALAGAILGGIGGIVAGRGIDALERIQPKMVTPGKGAGATAKTVAEKSVEGLKKALNKPMKDLAGEDVYGRGGIVSKFFRILENQFKWGLDEKLNTAITRARGFPSEIVDRANVALKQAMTYNPPAEISKVINQFLDGSLITAREELTFLQANGGITEEAFKKLSSVQKGNYSLWTVRDTGPTGKMVIQKWYTNTPIRDSFLSLQEKALLQRIPEDWRILANLQIEGRRGMNQFQQIVADALPPGQLKDKLEDSIGRYVPRMYRIFTDPKYKVTEEKVTAAMKEFGISKSQRELDDAIARYKAAPSDQYNNKLGEYKRRSDLQAQTRLANLQKFQPVEVDGKKYMASPEIVETLLKYKNEDFLRREIHAYLDDLSANKQLIGAGKGIDKTLFIEREDIGPAWRDMLGEYTDPVERMAMGVQKMYAPSQAAKLVSMVRDMKIDGLPVAMSGDTWSAMNTSLREAIDGTTDPTALARLQSQLNVLNSYKKLPVDIKFGEYAGLYTNRFLGDYFTDDNRMWETSIGRHMAEFNRLFKTFHIPLNPVSQLRQIISMPIFAAIGRATPAAFGQATRAYRNLTPKLRAELLREGIWTADFIRGELTGTANSILNGRYDSSVVKTLRKGVEGMLEAYRVPDMLVRGATYIAAKNRIALKLGKAIDDPEVIQRAVQWTDRYTMNYDNISKFVRGARNIPFVNPFISFQAEMLRILKNFMVDTAKGDIERMATLGGLISIPFMLTAAGESSLSEDDRKEWNKTKAILPEYMRYQSLVPIARLQNGKFKYVAIGPIIPQDNFEQSVRALAAGDGDAFAAVNPFVSRNSSPLFNMISELVTGEDKQTGLKFRSNREALSNVISDFLPPLAPGGYEWKRLANVGVENLRSGKVEDWGDIALRYTTGLSSGVIKPDSVLASAKGKLKRDIADLRQHYVRIAGTTMPDEDKKEAYDQYREGVTVLIQDFAERYGTDQQTRTNSN